jgi:hypothetical protein
MAGPLSLEYHLFVEKTVCITTIACHRVLVGANIDPQSSCVTAGRRDPDVLTALGKSRVYAIRTDLNL